MHDIFAAQMWSWPDPLLKRDAQGQVLFVNEAFLRLYGGQVQDWHGNAVGGWPAPQGGPAPSRFETRMPAPEGQIAAERVYDWLESNMMDGTALCIGRDVTDLLVPTPGGGLPLPADNMPPATRQTSFMPPLASTDPMPGQPLQAPPLHAPAAQAPLQSDNANAAGNFETSPAAETPPVADTFDPTPTQEAPVQTPTQAPQQEPLVANVEAPLVTQAEAPELTPATTETTPEVAMPSVPEFEPLVEQNTAAETPAVEAPEAISEPDIITPRRALPIQDSSSVLGSNWRDAVIAKAVGATAEDTGATAAKTGTHPASPSGGVGPHRILLAEDNAINALLTRTLLEAEGCIVDVVEDGQLAVEAMKTTSYDMIFMDMRMPNMDGLESTRKIRTLPNVPAGLPIVALTANAFDDDRNACFDSGMNDFMTKPVSAEELSEMVKRWAGKDADMKAAS